MEAVAVLALAVGAGVAAVAWRLRAGSDARLGQELAREAEALGMKPTVKRGHQGWFRISDTVDGHPVQLAARKPRFSEGSAVDHRVLTVQPIPTDLVLGSSGGFVVKLGDLPHPRVTTGDSAFDTEVVLACDQLTQAAICDRQTRFDVRWILREDPKITVEEGDVYFRSNQPLAKHRPLRETVRNMIRLAKLLALPSTHVAARLAARTNDEREVEDRLDCLRLLQREFPDAPETRDACEQALTAQRAKLRMCAAAHLGNDGNATAAEILASASVAQKTRRRALAHVVVRMSAAELLPVYEEALPSAPPRLRLELIESLGRFEDPAAAEPLITLLGSPESDVRAESAVALGNLNAPAAEAPLIERLSDDDGAVRSAAIRALGRSGSLNAVEPLYELTRGLLGGDQASAAREAIARIQERHGGGERGSLSVADDSDVAGAISLPRQEGALSVADEGESGED